MHAMQNVSKLFYLSNTYHNFLVSFNSKMNQLRNFSNLHEQTDISTTSAGVTQFAICYVKLVLLLIYNTFITISQHWESNM